MSPSTVYKMTLSAEQLALVEQHLGALSLQEFTLAALLDRCNGSAAEHALRAEVERLHGTLRDVLSSRRELPGEPSELPSDLLDDLLSRPAPRASVSTPKELDWS